MNKLLLAMCLCCAVAGPALADDCSGGSGHVKVVACINSPPPEGGNGGTVTAPEVDPASAASALVLLVGGLLVLRGRRSGVRTG